MHVALVVFLADPFPSPEEAVRRMCHAALGVEVEPETDTVDRAPAHRFRFSLGGQSFRVTASDQPHPDGVELASRIEDAPDRDRFANHRAFLAVEWIESGDMPEFEAAYHPICRVLAEACDANAIATFAPQWDSFALVTGDTADLLLSAHPLVELGVVHSRLGCLIREGSMWISAFPTRWGPVQISAVGGPAGPPRAHTDRMREIVEHKLRLFRVKLLFSLFYRPCQVLLDKDGEISVEYRNWLTGTRRHFVSESDAPH